MNQSWNWIQKEILNDMQSMEFQMMYVLQITTQNFLNQFNFNNNNKKAENTHVSIINSIRVLTFFFTNSKWSGPTHLTTTPNDP